MGRCDRIAFGLGGLILVGEERLATCLAQVLLDVVGEHAPQDVGTHPILETAVDGADFQIHRFE